MCPHRAEKRVALVRWAEELRTLIERPASVAQAEVQRERDKPTKGTARLRLVGSS
jgi:hypothetical protein